MTALLPEDAGAEPLAVLLSAECRALRRTLRPLAWVTLEEVALDAAVEDGRLVARTSARQVAERLGVDPGTAATALQALRERGLVALEREKGPRGRFGLSVYELGPVAGLSVVRPRTAAPLMVSPQLGSTPAASATSEAPESGRPDRSAPGTAGPGTLAPPVLAGNYGSGAPLRSGSAARPVPDTAPARPAHFAGQERFDLGSVAP